MCIIALKPEKKIFSRTQLKTMWDNNPDGAGFMYAEGGKVHIIKGLMTLDALCAAMEQVGQARKMVIHFRIKTHGAVSGALTHPFWITKDKLGMVHNGVIRALVNETSENESDTAVFARKFSAAYQDPITAIKHEFHRDMLESYIGFSKMVFMDETGATYILNEALGEWHGNVWYSNDKYKVEKGLVASTAHKVVTTDGEVKFPWELGKFEKTDREATQARLDAVFGHVVRTDRGGRSETVTHVTKGKSENGQKRRQKPLLGLPSTQKVFSKWAKDDKDSY